MTADARAEFQILHYGDELTNAHVDGLTDFLTTKLEALASASETDTDGRRTADALQALVLAIADGARHGIRHRDADLARGLDSTWTLVHRQEVRREWNRLVDITDRWRGTSDVYRYAPWTRVEHHNAESEALEAAERAAKAGEAPASGDHPVAEPTAAAAEPEIYADRLTREHLDALYAFLKRHIDQLLALHPAGTEEHRAALALDTAIDVARDEVHDSFTYDSGRDRNLEDRRDAWNRLRQLSKPYKGDPEFDTTRWPRIKYLPLHAAEEHIPAQDRPTREAHA